MTNKNKPNTTFSRNIFSIPNQSMPYPSNYPKSDITSFSGNLSKNLFINKRILLPIILSMPILGAVKPNKKVSIFTKILNFFGIKTRKQKEEERRNEKKLNTISNIILDNLKEGTFGIKEVKEIKETLQNEEIPPEEKKDKTTNFLQKYNCVKDVKKAIEDASDNETDDNDFLDSIEKSIDRMEQKIESDEYIKKTLKTQQKIIDIKNIILENSKPDKINREEIKDIKTTLNNNTITPEKKRIEIQDFLRKNKIEKEVKEVIGDENDELENLFTQAINKLPIKDIPKKPKSSSSSSSSRSGDSYHYTTYNTYNTPASPPPADPKVHHYHHYYFNTMFNPHPSFISLRKPVYSDYRDYSGGPRVVVQPSGYEDFHTCYSPFTGPLYDYTFSLNNPRESISEGEEEEDFDMDNNSESKPEPSDIPKIDTEQEVAVELPQTQNNTPPEIKPISYDEMAEELGEQVDQGNRILQQMLIDVASGQNPDNTIAELENLKENLAEEDPQRAYLDSIIRCAQLLFNEDGLVEVSSSDAESYHTCCSPSPDPFEGQPLDAESYHTCYPPSPESLDDYTSSLNNTSEAISEGEAEEDFDNSTPNYTLLKEVKEVIGDENDELENLFTQAINKLPIKDIPKKPKSSSSSSSSRSGDSYHYTTYNTYNTPASPPPADPEPLTPRSAQSYESFCYQSDDINPEPSDESTFSRSQGIAIEESVGNSLEPEIENQINITSPPMRLKSTIQQPINNPPEPISDSGDEEYEEYEEEELSPAEEAAQTQDNTPPEIQPISCDEMAKELGERVNEGNMILQQMLIDVASGKNPYNMIKKIENLKENLAEDDSQRTYLDSIISCAKLLFDEKDSVKECYCKWNKYRRTQAEQLEKLGWELSYTAVIREKSFANKTRVNYMCVLAFKLINLDCSSKAKLTYQWSADPEGDANLGNLQTLVEG